MQPHVGEYALVALGGAFGVLSRYLLMEAADAHEIVMLLAINSAGSFLLGLLLSAVAPSPGNHRGRRRRLFLGTGFLGGFTTYSALALTTVGMAQVWQSAAYGLVTVVVGIALALLGAAVGRPFHRMGRPTG